MGCKDIECKISEHTQEIDSLYEYFIYACVKAAQLSIPSSGNHVIRLNRLAGWSPELDLAREKSLFRHDIWKCDKPEKNG